MAYNNYYGQGYSYVPYYPATYQPLIQPQMIQQPQMQTAQMPVASQNQQTSGQIQNGGFITVHSESEARSYPVAPGTSVTFKHETAPYCYTKTMGFSQFEAPKFEKFRLVKEDEVENQQADSKEIAPQAFATEEDLSKVVGVVKGINEVVGALKSDVDSLKSDMYGALGKRKTAKKAEAEDDT